MKAWFPRRDDKRRLLSSRGGVCQGSRLQPLPPPPLAMAQRDALDRAFARRAEGEKIEQRPENPGCERESRRGEEDRAPPEQFDDRARLAALGGGERRELGDILRAL